MPDSPLDGIRSPFGRRRGGGPAPAFSPTSLYSSGSQGIWLDPSDLSTMFSDRAGTVQVTTPGTVVGKRLDKSGRGNHATAPTDAARPIYGVEPKGGRRNLLTWSEDFRDTAAAGEIRPWVRTSATVTPNDATAPDGTITADKITASAGSGDPRVAVLQTVPDPQTISQTITVYLKQGTARYAMLAHEWGVNWLYAVVDLQTGNITQSNNSGTGVLVGSSASAAANGFFRVSITGYIGTGPNDATVIRVLNTGTPSVPTGSGIQPTYTAAGTENIFIWGAQLELGSTATAYQRVTNAYDVTESGVATCHYVQYDGSDDSLSTSAIDFTGTDKMSVFAGVRKLSDASINSIAELSADANSNSGTFWLFCSNGGGNWNFRSRGNTGNYPIATKGSSPSPETALLSGIGDISGDVTRLRYNGAVAATDTTDQGTGTFGNYPLFIGRRGNASLPFNGRDYGLIVVGKAASAGEISDTETWLAARTAQVTL